MESELNSFYGSLVKRKIEPYIYSSWVRKTSGKKDVMRFMVATEAALYITKRAVLGRGFKISKLYPWVKLSNIEITPPENVTLAFGEQRISLVIAGIEEFSSAVALFLSGCLPKKFHYSFRSPFSSGGTYMMPLKRYIPSLYVSECHAAEIPINGAFFSFLTREATSSCESLDLRQWDFDKRLIATFIPVLEMTQTIISLRFSGSKFKNVLKYVARILSKNSSIRRLTIESVHKWKYWSAFVSAVDQSNVIGLVIEACHLSDDRFTQLMEMKRLPNIQVLVLDGCKLSAASMERMCNHTMRFKSLSALTIKNNKNVFNKGIIRSMSNLCCQHSISSLTLADLGMKIEWLFIYIGNLQFLEKLNVSGNVFDEMPRQPFSLPAKLKSLNFSKVHWKPFTLFKVLTSQNYPNGTSLNISNVQLDSSEWESFYNQLREITDFSMNIKSLNWSDNPLDSRFLTFLLTMKELEWLGLNRCRYGDDQVRSLVENLTRVITELPITGFEMKGFKKQPNKTIITEMIPVLEEKGTITDLDISNNKIGNVGLNLLQKFVSSSNNLRSLCFDGSRPTKVGSLSKLLKKLCDSETVSRVPLPECDIKSVVSKAPAMKETIKQIWDELEEKIRLREAARAFEDSDRSVSERPLFPTTSALGTSGFFDTFSTPHEMVLTASWNVELNVPFNSGFREWENLRQRYSLTEVSHIDVS